MLEWCHGLRRFWRGSLSILALVVFPGLPARAQLAPDLHWETLRTAHFRVHFSPGLETVARRAGGSAERAYALLAAQLHEPRGPIDLVVADNVDISNGYATTFPTNRIVIWARPAVEATSLRFFDDWVDLVVSHELAHIFHLDRTRGWWRLGQRVFGRNPFLFPNDYAPGWLIEGIAVWQESQLTGSGRRVGTDFPMVVRAHALAGTTPALNALSLSSPLYPLGNVAYAYGTLLVDAAVRAGGASSAGEPAVPGAEGGTPGVGPLRRFVESSASFPLPYFLDRHAKRAFGASFDSVYRAWRDSVRREALWLAERTPPREPLVRGAWFSQRLRWESDTHLLYARADAKSLPALGRVDATGGRSEVVAIRNTTDATSPLPGGWRVFAQRDFTDRYTERSDLYVERSDDRGTTRAVHRLTTGARLLQPDARLCGPRAAPDASRIADHPSLCIVAVQLLPGASRLVRVQTFGDSVGIVPLTAAAADTVWREPRYSASGDRIAAARWMHGGTSDIVVLDLGGREVQSVARSRAVNGAPAWGPGDSTIWFTSDRSGRSALYRANLGSGALERVAESATGLFESELSPDGSRVASFELMDTGMSIVVLPAGSGGTPADSASVLPPSRNLPVVTADAPSRPYSAWRTVLPRYWLPAAEVNDDNRTMWGLISSGSDVIGRHAWQAQGTYEPEHQEPSWNVAYGFAGFGNPTAGLAGSQTWDHFILTDSARREIGLLSRRKYFADVSLTFARPRMRTYHALSLGVEYEWRDFRTEPRSLFPQLDPSLRRRYTYPSFFASASFSNARQPYLALGPENGIALGASVRRRWRTDDPGATRSTTLSGVATGFRAFDLGGFAHHVVALRAAAAAQDVTSATELEAGGISGTLMQIAPGVVLGDGRRTFFARGFPAGAQIGNRAAGVNVEYRLPLWLPASGLWRFPLYFQRVSATLFTDAATAWCPAARPSSAFCRSVTSPDWMASAGAELDLDAALAYDRPYRFRVGAAVPTAGRSYFGTSEVAVYFTVGVPF